jgi:hypothetical protein
MKVAIFLLPGAEIAWRHRKKLETMYLKRPSIAAGASHNRIGGL